MNIVISLDCSPEQAAAVLDGFKGVLSANGLESTSFGIGGISAYHCFPQAVDTDTEPELPPEPMGDPVGLPSVELPPGVSVSPAGITAMISPAPMGNAIGGELPADAPTEPIVEPEAEKAPAPVFGDVRILTLSTSFFIPSTVVPAQNTVLKVFGLQVSEGIIRFSYNGFEHALPVADITDSSIANSSHTNGPTTVRLVVDIANKVQPCLIDVENGDKEELLIGDDLIPAIVETAENVPTE